LKHVYDNTHMRTAPILDRIKVGERIQKPPIRVKSTIPPDWNPNSTESFAKAAEVWRKR
jgi:hypothetical protein